ncbi:Ger(x)C family spore germination protein [Peptococcaceae bacterium 1198_IL3148]
MRKKHLIKLTAVILILTLLTGCWGNNDIEDLFLVLGVGIDRAGEDYLTTLQVVRTSVLQTSSSGNGGGQESPIISYSAAGRTVFETVRNMAKQSTRQLFFSHNQIYVIGEEAAKAGISSLLDFVSRDVELLYSTLIVTCRGQASDLLQTEVEEQLPAMAITNVFKNVDKHGQSMEVNLKDLSLFINAPSGAYLIPTLKAISAAQGKEKHFELDGAGVFKGDKLVGYINTDQMRGYLLTIGKLQGGLAVVADPTTPGNQIALEVLSANSKLKPLLENGRPVVEVEVSEKVILANENILRRQLTKEMVTAIEEHASQAIVSHIENVFATAQSMQADIFGFGNLFHRKMPREFKNMEAHWDQLFSKMEIRIHADCRVISNGLKAGKKFDE